MRGPAPADAPLPALGYLHVEGRAFTNGGSRANPVEARTIAAWLEENRARLEGGYDLPLERVVGVVTPFGQQVRAIRDACTARGITVSGRDGMTIGTVHALQGAERSVVIFSPVYSKHADGGFIDASPSMLNVTVSRAKDSCLVFGGMDILATARNGSSLHFPSISPALSSALFGADANVAGGSVLLAQNPPKWVNFARRFTGAFIRSPAHLIQHLVNQADRLRCRNCLLVVPVVPVVPVVHRTRRDRTGKTFDLDSFRLRTSRQP
jgi:hypothetical protein